MADEWQRMLALSGWSRAEDFIIIFQQCFCFSCVWPTVRTPNVLGINHSRNEKGTGAEMRPAMVCGIVTGDAPVSYWPILSLGISSRSLCES